VPEYLRPGVYVEETSYRAKSIEGVSTSTAGFVGRARKGPVGVPTLVTSFAEFVREFGAPYAVPDAQAGGFLGHAVKGFFDNGGRRVYCVRVLHGDAVASRVHALNGNLLRLPRNTVLPPTDGSTPRRELPLDSLRGVQVGTELQIFTRSGAGFARLAGTYRVGAYDAHSNTVTLAAAADAIPPAVRLHWQHTYVLIDGTAGNRPTATPARQPEFVARFAGDEGDRLSVRFTNADRPPVRLATREYTRASTPASTTTTLALTTTAGLEVGDAIVVWDGTTQHATSVAGPITSSTIGIDPARAVPPAMSTWDRVELLVVGRAETGPDTLSVRSTANFYTGAIIEVDPGPGSSVSKQVTTVIAVDPEARTLTVANLASDIVLPSDPANRAAFVRVLESSIDVLENGVVRESFQGLGWNSDTDDTLGSFSRYYVRALNDPESGSRLITVMAPTATGTTLAFTPTNGTSDPLPLTGGADGPPPARQHLIGIDAGPGNRTGIQALIARPDISIVAVPGVTDEFVQQALITHCELARYRMAVLDGDKNDGNAADLEAHRNRYDSKYAALYAPWLQTLDVTSGRVLSAPPSGHVAGIYARVDNERGVHKAPANEVVRGIADLLFAFTDGEQDVLNPVGVNLIREFPGRGLRVWGARTISSDPEWKYVNVRRLFLFLEASIDRGTQWVVFEPNNEALWDRVRQTIESFLFGVWASGALMGSTPEEGYFVKCDRSTMTQNDIDNGRLVCEIGVAPTYPAEFVIFRIGQFTASASEA